MQARRPARGWRLLDRACVASVNDLVRRVRGGALIKVAAAHSSGVIAKPQVQSAYQQAAAQLPEAP